MTFLDLKKILKLDCLLFCLHRSSKDPTIAQSLVIFATRHGDFKKASLDFNLLSTRFTTYEIKVTRFRALCSTSLHLWHPWIVQFNKKVSWVKRNDKLGTFWNTLYDLHSVLAARCTILLQLVLITLLLLQGVSYWNGRI